MTKLTAILFWHRNGYCCAAAGASSSTGPFPTLHDAFLHAEAEGLHVVDVQRTKGLLPDVAEKGTP